MSCQCWPIDQYFGECSIINPTFMGFEEHLIIGQFNFALDQTVVAMYSCNSWLSQSF